MKLHRRIIEYILERFPKTMMVLFCVTLITATGVALAAYNMKDKQVKVSASVAGSGKVNTANTLSSDSAAGTTTVGSIGTSTASGGIGDSSLLTRVSTTQDSLNEYLERKAAATASPDITEEEIKDMLSDDSKEVEIISPEYLDVGQEEESQLHENVEVVSEQGAELALEENSALSYGIDVSHYQKEIDWARVKASGIDFAMIKCGGRSTGDDATLYEDGLFDDNIQGALANGIQVGIYFFSQATTVKEAYEEASYCVSLIERYQITYPVAFDWESAQGYRVNTAGLDSQTLTQIVETFCDTVSGCGYQPMVYFCRNDWYGIVDAQALIDKYRTWLAVYYDEYYYKDATWQYGNSVAEFDYKYDMWQYGVSDSVDGIDGYVDMDIAFFSYDNYEVKGMQDPQLTVTNTQLQVRKGQKADLLDGVSDINCLGYVADITCKIEGAEDTDTSKLATGTYTVTYSFKDPKTGTLSRTAELKVYDNARIEISDPAPTIYVGDSYNCLKGITAYDSNGNKVTPSYLVTRNGAAVNSFKKAGTYKITYNFKDANQGVITAVVNLKVVDKNTGTTEASDATAATNGDIYRVK